MANFAGNIAEQIGELGKQIGTEVAKVPTDIAGKALESLGASSGKKQGTNQVKVGSANATPIGESGPLQNLDGEKDQRVKQAIARAALEQIAGVSPRQKEPSVWEKLQMEEKQKKEMRQKQAASQNAALPMATAKRPRGDLYGAKTKRAGAEMSRNVKQD